MRSHALALVMAAAVVRVMTAQPIDLQNVGPKVGERVADFTLQDQHGVAHSLRSTFGPKGAVLVFFRSADW
jgi:hypothetical protein